MSGMSEIALQKAKMREIWAFIIPPELLGREQSIISHLEPKGESSLYLGVALRFCLSIAVHTLLIALENLYGDVE
jgi:hypothetical protein